MTPWMDPSNYGINMFAFQTFLISVIVFMLGAMILFRERGSAVGVSYALCTLTIGIWLSTFSFMYSALNESTAFFWAKAAYLGVPFIPSAIYQFTVVILRIHARHRRRVIACWLLSSFFAAMILATDALIMGLYKYPWGYYPKYGALSVPYLAFFFGTMVLTLRLYWTESRNTTEGTQAHLRAKRLMAALVIAYLGSIDYLPKFGVSVYPMGYLFVFCFLLLAADVIWQYRLVNITAAFAADQILLTMNEPLIVCDLEGIIHIVNSAYRRLFGYEQDNLRGRHIQFLSGGHQWQKKMMNDGSVKNYECTFWGHGGTQIVVSLSASVLRSSDGKPQGYVIVARDISERKKIERQMQELNETLEDRVRKRTEELGNKIRELEWLNTVMMGREERILELKEQLRGQEEQAQSQKETGDERVADQSPHH